jgi:hypothetical protein
MTNSVRRIKAFLSRLASPVLGATPEEKRNQPGYPNGRSQAIRTGNANSVPELSVKMPEENLNRCDDPP